MKDGLPSFLSGLLHCPLGSFLHSYSSVLCLVTFPMCSRNGFHNPQQMWKCQPYVFLRTDLLLFGPHWEWVIKYSKYFKLKQVIKLVTSNLNKDKSKILCFFYSHSLGLLTWMTKVLREMNKLPPMFGDIKQMRLSVPWRGQYFCFRCYWRVNSIKSRS